MTYNPEDLVEAIRLRCGMAPDIWLLGHKHKAENRSPPLYIWYPDTIDDKPAEDGSSAATALLGFVVQIWGVDLADAFTRYLQLRTALYLEAESSVTILRGSFAPR